jgi:ABC-type nitrate/sulfonate/bicarbonate transport system permease component
MNPLAAPEQASAGQATLPQAKPAGRLLRRVWRLPGLRTLVPPVLLLAAGVALWQLLVSLKHVDSQIFPGPWLVARATWGDRTDLWPAISVTTEEAVLGLAVAILVALVTAVAIDTWVPVRRSLYPLIVASQTIPMIALAPLVLIWWGFGLLPKVVLVALFSFFPVAVGLVQGLNSTDPDTLNLLRTMRASRRQLLLRVRLPSSLPQFFTGLKISVTYAYTAAIVAEFVGAEQGLGLYMYTAAHAAPVETDLVFGSIIVVALLTIVLFLLVGLAERVAMPWRPRR